MCQTYASRKDLEKFAASVNRITQKAIPFHTNQWNEPNNDLARERIIRGRFTRKMRRWSPSAKRVDGNSVRLDDLALMARSAETFGAGVCNDNSASVVLTLMRNEEKLPPLPFFRFWNENYQHSYVTFGDPRTPESVIIDPWSNREWPESKDSFKTASSLLTNLYMDAPAAYQSSCFFSRSPGELRKKADRSTASADEQLAKNYDSVIASSDYRFLSIPYVTPYSYPFAATDEPLLDLTKPPLPPKLTHFEETLLPSLLAATDMRVSPVSSWPRTAQIFSVSPPHTVRHIPIRQPTHPVYRRSAAFAPSGGAVPPVSSHLPALVSRPAQGGPATRAQPVPARAVPLPPMSRRRFWPPL